MTKSTQRSSSEAPARHIGRIIVPALLLCALLASPASLPAYGMAAKATWQEASSFLGLTDS